MKKSFSLVGMFMAALLVAVTAGCIFPGDGEPVSEQTGPSQDESGDRSELPTETPILYGLNDPIETPTEESRPTPTPMPTSTPSYQPVFVEGSCPFELPEGQVEGVTVDCGTLKVLENHAETEGRKINLAVAIFRHPSGKSEPDPIIYLEGGPGGSALEFINLSFENRYKPIFAADRDIILFDQRGVGFSEPALDCPAYSDLGIELLDNEIDGEVLTDAEMYDLSGEYLESCAQDLRQQADLAMYNSNENAADVEDLRLALGYEKVNLWGISYGTRLALEVMRDYPAGIRSVVLDSVAPPDIDVFVETPLNARRAFDVLFAACANDPACNQDYPDLETVVFRTVDRLNQDSAQFEIFDPLADERYDTIIDGDSYLSLLFQMLYDSEIIPILPQLIYETDNGYYDKVAALLGLIIATRDSTSDGMNLAVNCFEEYPFYSLEVFDANVAQVPELAGWFEYGSIRHNFSICGAWQSSQEDAGENQPVSSDLPVLVMSGEFDPITPPAYGEWVAGTLSNAYVYEYPGLGHGSSSDEGCSQDMVLAFWDDPSTAPDSTCISDMGLPKFITTSGDEITFEPYQSASMGIQGQIPAGWEEINTGVYARNNSSLDGTVLLAQAAPGFPVDELLALFTQQLGLDEEPEVVDQRIANSLTWYLYRFDVQGFQVDMALAEDGDRGYVALLQSSPSERDALFERVFLPVVDSLGPVQ